MEDAVKSALKTQYHAAFAMLCDRITDCPDDMWEGGQFPRLYWKIAYHAAFYGDLYLQSRYEDFKPWEKHQDDAQGIFDNVVDMTAFSKEEVLAYAKEVKSRIDALIDGAELMREDSGFHWYDMPKLDHLMLGMRHVMEHVGQLGERLITVGVDIEWRSCSRSKPC